MNKSIIDECWDDRKLLSSQEHINNIKACISSLDKGLVRIAEKKNKKWIVNTYLKKAVILYFAIAKMKSFELEDFSFYDKIALKRDFKSTGVRAVPLALARFGSYLAEKVVLMPSYINIGAYVGKGTMVDTWATVGSCAQIGSHVHLSGGVGVGGVLEPIQNQPVIIEDDVFIGSRSIIVEGVQIDKEAVIGANTTLTASTKIIDVTEKEPIHYKGYIPPRSVVIPGSYTKKFPAGVFQVNCALIIGKRKESTDKKTALNQTLRAFNVEV